jgi:hypothetical protein
MVWKGGGTGLLQRRFVTRGERLRLIAFSQGQQMDPLRSSVTEAKVHVITVITN